MSEIITWQGSPVAVHARLIPRFLWSTASIDVFLGEHCILRTGGQLKFTGAHSETFTHSGSSHTAELSWGTTGLSSSFPYQLRIDGTPVSASRVRIQNRLMGFVGVIIFAALLFLILYIVNHVSRA